MGNFTLEYEWECSILLDEWMKSDEISLRNGFDIFLGRLGIKIAFFTNGGYVFKFDTEADMIKFIMEYV